MMFRHHPPMKVAAASVVALAAVWPAGEALAQLRVIIADGEVVVEQDGRADQPRVEVMLAEPAAAAVPLAPPLDAADPAIGDAWWDDAAERPTVAAADGPPPVRNLAQQRLAVQRRSQAMEILRRELSLVRAACPTLEPEARETILAAARAAADAPGAGGPQAIEAAVDRAVQAVAGSPAAVAYRREVAARDRRRRAAAAAVLVEAIDRDALFDGRTRRDLAAALEDAWNPAWDQLALLAGRQRVTGGRLPPGVESVVASVLDTTSFAAWRERREPIQP
jgi:hypothetical protein